MTRAAAAVAAAGSSTLSSSSATKSSSACSTTFGAGRGLALRPAPTNLPMREHVSFCSQLTPVALARTSQINDEFLSPVVNGSLLGVANCANAISGGGTLHMAVSSLFCSPAVVMNAPDGLNEDQSNSCSQSQLQSSTTSVTSAQHPSAATTPLETQKSSLSVEFPPSFPYRLSQQDPAAPASQRRTHNAMDIGDYCVGTLPSLCTINDAGLLQSGAPRHLPSLVSDPPAVALVLMPETRVSAREERSQPAVDSASEAALAVDLSARKRRRVAASRNFGERVVRNGSCRARVERVERVEESCCHLTLW